MKRRAFFLTLLSGVVVLLVTAAVSFFWILAQSPLDLLKGGVKAEPSAAIFVPRQAPVMVSLLVNPDRLEALGELSGSLGERQRSQREFEQVKKSLLANTGLDYTEDIQPWLGDEITLAVTSLDYDRIRANGIEPGYLLVAKTKDPELAREFLQLSFSEKALDPSVDLVFEQYKGVNLIYQRSLPPAISRKGTVSAVVGDFVLFANSPKVMRDAINNVQATDLNLQNSSSYVEALETIVEPRVGIAYVNLPALSAWIVNAPVPENPQAEQLLTVALKLTPEGIAAPTALIGVADQETRQPALSEPVAALRYVPAESLFTAAGTDLNRFWTQIESGLDSDSPLQQLVNRVIDSIETRLRLDLPQDIFSWVKGEYALALVSNPQQNRLDWLFVAEKTADLEAQAAIEHLDTLASRQGLSTGKLPLLDKQIFAWTKFVTAVRDRPNSLRLDTQVQGVHTSVDNYEIFATSIETIAQALSGKQNSLLNNEKFQEAIAALPTANDGYFYLDWEQGKPVFEQQVPLIQVTEIAAKPLFNHLRSLGISSQGSQNGVRRGTVFFNLAADPT